MRDNPHKSRADPGAKQATTDESSIERKEGSHEENRKGGPG